MEVKAHGLNLPLVSLMSNVLKSIQMSMFSRKRRTAAEAAPTSEVTTKPFTVEDDPRKIEDAFPREPRRILTPDDPRHSPNQRMIATPFAAERNGIHVAKSVGSCKHQSRVNTGEPDEPATVAITRSNMKNTRQGPIRTIEECKEEVVHSSKNSMPGRSVESVDPENACVSALAYLSLRNESLVQDHVQEQGRSTGANCVDCTGLGVGPHSSISQSSVGDKTMATRISLADVMRKKTFDKVPTDAYAGLPENCSRRTILSKASQNSQRSILSTSSLRSILSTSSRMSIISTSSRSSHRARDPNRRVSFSDDETDYGYSDGFPSGVLPSNTMNTCDAGMKRSRRRKGPPNRPTSVITCPSMNVDHYERPRNPKNFSSLVQGEGIVEMPVQPGCGMAPLGLDESSFEGCSSSVYTVRISLSDSMECTLYEADAAKDTPPTKPSRRGSR